MPEVFVSGDIGPDGLTAYFALLDATSTGKRGAHGSAMSDPAAAELFGVSVRTIERWRAQLEAAGYCRTEAEGRYARKRVGKAWDGEPFVMYPTLVVRALLSGEIGPFAFRLWIAATNRRIETGDQAGCWLGTGALARLFGRKRATIAAALAELVDAALLRVDDFGPGRGRRLIPQFARPVTQRLSASVRRARDAVYRRAGLLKKPQLARAAVYPPTPSPGVGSTPSLDVGSAGRSTGMNAQVGTESDAPRVGRDLFQGDLDEGSPPDWELLARYSRYVRNRM